MDTEIWLIKFKPSKTEKERNQMYIYICEGVGSKAIQGNKSTYETEGWKHIYVKKIRIILHKFYTTHNLKNNNNILHIY